LLRDMVITVKDNTLIISVLKSVGNVDRQLII